MKIAFKGVGLFFFASVVQSVLFAGGWNCASGTMSGGAAGRVSLLLLSLAVGYGVLVLSQSQQKPLNTLGRVIGGIILIVSFVGLLCAAACGMKRWCGKSMMCDLGKKASCPVSSQTTESAPVTPSTNQ